MTRIALVAAIALAACTATGNGDPQLICVANAIGASPSCAPASDGGGIALQDPQWRDATGRVWGPVCDESIITIIDPSSCAAGVAYGPSCSTRAPTCARGAPPRCVVICDPNADAGTAPDGG